MDDNREFTNWQDHWEYAATNELNNFEIMTEVQLLEVLERGNIGSFYTFWMALGDKGRLKTSGPKIVKFLKDHPGDRFMLNRYHAAAALFKMIGEDPKRLRPRVQWDHNGEDARQKAIGELERLIDKTK